VRAFVTGIAGFLGSHLAEYLLAQGHTVHGCDDLSSGVVSNIPDAILKRWNGGWAQADICYGVGEPWLKEQMQGCEVVYHCAAAAYEGVSVFSPGFISTNIYAGSANVFSAAIQAGVRRIVNCSSMARYGNHPRPPFYEGFICDPVDPYGLAKLNAEGLGRMLSKIHGIEFVTAVPHNIYGPKQNYWTPYRNVAAIMANRALQGKQPIIYGDGTQVRCFSHVNDVVPCLAAMAHHDCKTYPVINLGPDDDEIMILKVAHIICEAVHMEFKPIFVPPRPCEVSRANCSSDLARQILDFKKTVSIEHGLNDLVRWVAQQGPKPFVYDVPIEIKTDITPKTWTDKLI
jgi:UDP-glucose 4-epimerase